MRQITRLAFRRKLWQLPLGGVPTTGKGDLFGVRWYGCRCGNPASSVRQRRSQATWTQLPDARD